MNEQIQQAGHILTPIFEHVKNGRFRDAYRAIDMATPHDSWVIELPSKSKDGQMYKTLKLDLMESLMKHIFYYAGIKRVSAPVISQDRNGGFAVTVNVLYEYTHFNGEETCILPGIATVYSPSLQLLEMATPKASSMATKNAIKQLGGLFGKYLNRNEESEDSIPAEDKKPSKEEQLDSLTQGLISAKSLTDIKSYRHIVYSPTMSNKEIQALYETRLRDFTKKSK